MKTLFLIAALMSTSAFSHQYIQCMEPDQSNVAVLSLLTPNMGTFFAAESVETAEEQNIFTGIEKSSSDDQYTTYKFVGDVHEGSVTIETKNIGQNLDSLTIELTLISDSVVNTHKYTCFSRMYSDEE
jgi:hypothetical protein